MHLSTDHSAKMPKKMKEKVQLYLCKSLPFVLLSGCAEGYSKDGKCYSVVFAFVMILTLSLICSQMLKMYESFKCVCTKLTDDLSIDKGAFFGGTSSPQPVRQYCTCQITECFFYKIVSVGSYNGTIMPVSTGNLTQVK